MEPAPSFPPDKSARRSPASSGSVAVSHLSLALDGIIAAIRLTITPAHATVGKPCRAAVTVTAYDAAGAAIVGASEYSQPIVLIDSRR